MHITPHTVAEPPRSARALIAASVGDTLSTLGGRSLEVMGPPECNSLVERVGELARTRLAPRAARYDAEAAFPIDNYRDLHAAGLLGALAINQAKYMCAEIGVSVTQQAMRMAGGRGILKELPLERWHRDALAGPVMPPADDRCLETIGKMLCGLEAATLEFQ